jgi:tetratricopeptide (TPR) repeat protein
MTSESINLRPLLFKFGVPLLTFALAVAAFALVNQTASNSSGTAPAVLDARSGAGTEGQIASLQDAVEAAPGDVRAATSLGDAYYLRARETGDPSFFVRADRAYSQALTTDPQDPYAITGSATLALARHDFGQGLELAQRAHRLAPDVLAPYAAIVDGQIELGRYGAAAGTLERMVDLKPNLASYSRISYFRELHGDLAGAVAAMRLAATAGGGGEALTYVQTLLGRLELDRGRYGAAELEFRRALATTPSYVPARAGLARVDAARGDLAGAIQRYRDAVERLPLPEYAIGLAEAELAAGRKAAADRDLALVEVETQLLRSAGVNVDVELALFEADHGDPTRAVALANRSWLRAPSVRSADAYSWALHAAGRDGAALELSREAMRLGSRDPYFLYHAGVIAAAAGETDLARELLGRVVAQSPRFSPYHGPRAERALEALR